MGLHALVVMPDGRTPEIDFAAIRARLLTPALAHAGFSVNEGFHGVEEAHDVLRADAIEQRLEADLVVIDSTSPDAPACALACYRRGVERALLARAILLVQADGRQASLFADGAPDFTYHLKDGEPDPAHLAADVQALARLVENYGGEPGNRYRSGALSVLARDTPARQVVLFSGHMIDTPERAASRTPRFPAAMESVAATAIAARLDAWNVGRYDLAICGGACGGDLLFAEAALQRGCPLQLHLQFREAEFLQASVADAGQRWVDRYRAVRDHPLTRVRVQPDELGPPARGLDPYVRNNLWQLYTALACGADDVRCIALWDGEDGDNPGGTQNMVETVSRHGGQVNIIDTRRLLGAAPPVKSAA